MSVLPLKGEYAVLLYRNGIRRIDRTATSNLSFADTLSKASSNSILPELEAKFGPKISVLDISKDGIDSLGRRSVGVGNVTIAPDILEKMAADPETRLYYEQKIQAHFDTNPEAQAFMSARGRRIVARGVTVHPDGKVTYWSRSDYTPEEKERIRCAQEEEKKEKAKKRAEMQRLIEEANERKIDVADSVEAYLCLIQAEACANANVF